MYNGSVVSSSGLIDSKQWTRIALTIDLSTNSAQILINKNLKTDYLNSSIDGNIIFPEFSYNFLGIYSVFSSNDLYENSNQDYFLLFYTSNHRSSISISNLMFINESLSQSEILKLWENFGK